MLLQTLVVLAIPKVNRWPIKHSNCLCKSFPPLPVNQDPIFHSQNVCVCMLGLKLPGLDGVQTSIHFYHRFRVCVFFFLGKVKSLMGLLHRGGIVPGEEVIDDKKKGV